MNKRPAGIGVPIERQQTMSARVLIVEDNADNLKLMSYLLGAFGHHVVTAIGLPERNERRLAERLRWIDARAAEARQGARTVWPEEIGNKNRNRAMRRHSPEEFEGGIQIGAAPFRFIEEDFANDA